MNRGAAAAAAATRIFRGDESRHRRGYHVDIPWRWVAAAPRPQRGQSVETARTARRGRDAESSVETGRRYALRRGLYRVALGAADAAAQIQTQQRTPMPGGAEPRYWRARDPADPDATVPPPQQVGANPLAPPPPPALDCAPQLTGINVFAAKLHAQRAALTAKGQATTPVDITKAWQQLPQSQRDDFNREAATRRKKA